MGEILLSFLFWVIGIVIGSFGIVQMLIIIRVGLPLTVKYARQGIINDPNRIVKMYLGSLIVLGIIVIGIWLLIRNFASQNSYYAFLVGIGMMFLAGLFKSGANKANISDYYESNKAYFITDIEQNTKS